MYELFRSNHETNILRWRCRWAGWAFLSLKNSNRWTKPNCKTQWWKQDALADILSGPYVPTCSASSWHLTNIINFTTPLNPGLPPPFDRNLARKLRNTECRLLSWLRLSYVLAEKEFSQKRSGISSCWCCCMQHLWNMSGVTPAQKTSGVSLSRLWTGISCKYDWWSTMCLFKPSAVHEPSPNVIPAVDIFSICCETTLPRPSTMQHQVDRPQMIPRIQQEAT